VKRLAVLLSRTVTGFTPLISSPKSPNCIYKPPREAEACRGLEKVINQKL